MRVFILLSNKNKGLGMFETMVTVFLFTLAFITFYKIISREIDRQNLEVVAADSAQKLVLFLKGLENYMVANGSAITSDTEIQCNTLVSQGYIQSSAVCQDKYGNTFKGRVVYDTTVSQIKNITVVVDICSNCPLSDEIERIRFFNMLSSKVSAFSKSEYKAFYVIRGHIFSSGSSYSDIQNLSNTENSTVYLNTNFQNQPKIVVARELVDSLGWWLWVAEVFWDGTTGAYRIIFFNQGYSRLCPSEYKRPIRITNGQILNPRTHDLVGREAITNSSYNVNIGFCIPAPKQYVDINKTLPERNAPISMSWYMAHTPCRENRRANVCCPVQNQPNFCVEVPAYIYGIPYWLYGFYSSTRVNTAHYHIKVGSKYYQLFIMQPHNAQVYYAWWAQAFFAFIVESNRDGIEFGFEWLDGSSYTLRPSVIRNIFWINWRGVLW